MRPKVTPVLTSMLSRIHLPASCCTAQSKQRGHTGGGGGVRVGSQPGAKRAATPHQR